MKSLKKNENKIYHCQLNVVLTSTLSLQSRVGGRRSHHRLHVVARPLHVVAVAAAGGLSGFFHYVIAVIDGVASVVGPVCGWGCCWGYGHCRV